MTSPPPKAPEPRERRLSDLPPGSTGTVAGVSAGGHPLGRRLLDLGFAPGTRVHVVRRAPLGDPVLYEVRGTRLCLRRGEAARIRVRSEAPDPGEERA